MPRDSEEIKCCLPLIQQLDKLKKHLTLIVHNRFRSQLPYPVHIHIEEIYDNEMNYFDIPKLSLMKRLHRFNTELIIDLNNRDQLVSMLCAQAVQAEYKIGLTRPYADRVYNLQVKLQGTDVVDSYQNYVNLLFTI